MIELIAGVAIGGFIGGTIGVLFVKSKSGALLARAEAQSNALKEKLETQKTEFESMRKQFNLEFENIATKILEDNSENSALRQKRMFL